MNLERIIQDLDLTVLTDPMDFATIEATTGYASDLLSCVMTGAKREGVWVTLQAHANVIAVAALLELAAIIVTEGASFDPAIIDKANQEGITVLSTSKQTFEVVGRLWELGLTA